MSKSPAAPAHWKLSKSGTNNDGLRGRRRIGPWSVERGGMADLLHTGRTQRVAQGLNIRAACRATVGHQTDFDQLMIEQRTFNFCGNRVGQPIGASLHDGLEVVGLLFEFAPLGVIQIQRH